MYSSFFTNIFAVCLIILAFVAFICYIKENPSDEFNAKNLKDLDSEK